MLPEFNPEAFNFNKIDEKEILHETVIAGTPVMFIINNCPLTNYQTLIIPDAKKSQPQVMTSKCIEIGLKLVSSTNDRAVRIGFNSPGAFASVNHLHMHMIYIEQELYVEKIQLRQIYGNLYAIDDKKRPLRGFCLSCENIESDARKLFELTKFCCVNSIPHNIFITKLHNSKTIRAFLFPRSVRKNNFENQATALLNVAVCELGGFIPLGNRDLFNSITETDVVEKFQAEMFEFSDVLEKNFIHLMLKFK